MQNTQAIPGIYNYCDRWCERCAFTNQCAVYDPAEVEGLGMNEGFFELMEEILDETLDMVRGAVLKDDPEGWEKIMDEILLLSEEFSSTPIEDSTLTLLSKEYFELCESWMEEHQALLQAKEEELNQKQLLGIDVSLEGERISDALEVIQWYLFFISAKIHRALSGLQDKEMIDLFGYQNDANGSAKIALIAIDRSLTAWETLRSFIPESTDDMLDILVLLTKIRIALQKLFPDTEKFIRPGFDEMGSAISDD